MGTDLYSIDKLVEFGMSLAIANQMVTSMNQTFNQMQIPGAGKVMPMNPENVYYAVINGAQCGPYSLSEILRLVMEKKIMKETYIWKPGMSQWDLAENISELLRMVASAPPPIPNLNKE